jgi:hypothetical protein
MQGPDVVRGAGKHFPVYLFRLGKSAVRVQRRALVESFH